MYLFSPKNIFFSNSRVRSTQKCVYFPPKTFFFLLFEGEIYPRVYLFTPKNIFFSDSRVGYTQKFIYFPPKTFFSLVHRGNRKVCFFKEGVGGWFFRIIYTLVIHQDVVYSAEISSDVPFKDLFAWFTPLHRYPYFLIKYWWFCIVASL